jgi:hypothetical protein
MVSLRPYQEQAADFLYESDRAMVLAPEWALVPDVWEYRDNELYWRVKCGRGTAVKHVGDKVAVKPDLLGYCYVTYRRKHYAVHRLVFLLAYGWLPDCVDHIDGNPSNNVAANLRAATRLQNQFNRKPNVKSKTGIKNVTSHQGRWIVRFSIDRKTVHYGCFDDIELAELVACEVRSMLHKEFARHA